MLRRFECKIDNHSKFWEIEQVTTETVRIRWGKIGREATWMNKVMRQTQTNKLIQEKLDKGYVEIKSKAEKPKPVKVDVKKMNRMLGNNNSLI